MEMRSGACEFLELPFDGTVDWLDPKDIAVLGPPQILSLQHERRGSDDLDGELRVCVAP